MSKTCFYCRLWVADLYKLTWGKCYFDKDNPQVKKASETCIFWNEPGEDRIRVVRSVV